MRHVGHKQDEADKDKDQVAIHSSWKTCPHGRMATWLSGTKSSRQQLHVFAQWAQLACVSPGVAEMGSMLSDPKGEVSASLDNGLKWRAGNRSELTLATAELQLQHSSSSEKRYLLRGTTSANMCLAQTSHA